MVVEQGRRAFNRGTSSRILPVDLIMPADIALKVRIFPSIVDSKPSMVV